MAHIGRLRVAQIGRRWVAQTTRLRLAQIARLPVVHIRAINDNTGVFAQVFGFTAPPPEARGSHVTRHCNWRLPCLRERTRRKAPRQDDLSYLNAIEGGFQVNPTKTSVFDLTPSEKLQLVEDLWDDLASTPEAAPIHGWQKDELARRKTNLMKAPASGLAWEEVKRRVRSRYAG